MSPNEPNSDTPTPAWITDALGDVAELAEELRAAVDDGCEGADERFVRIVLGAAAHGATLQARPHLVRRFVKTFVRDALATYDPIIVEYVVDWTISVVDVAYLLHGPAAFAPDSKVLDELRTVFEG